MTKTRTYNTRYARNEKNPEFVNVVIDISDKARLPRKLKKSLKKQGFVLKRG